MMEAITQAEAFTPEECNMILAAAATLESRDGAIGGVGVSSHARRASTRWLKKDDFGWVYERVVNISMATNGEAWGFERIDGAESIQISAYESAVSGYYNWHADTSMSGDTVAIRRRVLSASVQLTDPAEYTGGELEVRVRTVVIFD